MEAPHVGDEGIEVPQSKGQRHRGGDGDGEHDDPRQDEVAQRRAEAGPSLAQGRTAPRGLEETEDDEGRDQREVLLRREEEPRGNRGREETPARACHEEGDEKDARDRLRPRLLQHEERARVEEEEEREEAELERAGFS